MEVSDAKYQTMLMDLRQYSAEYLRLYRAEYLRLSRMTTALETAHEKALQCLENSLPPRPGAF